MTPVVPTPTGQEALPQMGQTLFIARSPAKIAHQPANLTTTALSALPGSGAEFSIRGASGTFDSGADW
jgi:hypothetical protein